MKPRPSPGEIKRNLEQAVEAREAELEELQQANEAADERRSNLLRSMREERWKGGSPPPERTEDAAQ